MSTNTVCALCNEGFEDSDPVQVKEKGLKTLVRISSDRGLEDLCRYVIVYF